MNRLGRFGEQMAGAQDGALRKLNAVARIRGRVLETAAMIADQRSRRRRVAIGFMAAGALAAAAVVLGWGIRQRPIGFVVGAAGDAGEVGGWIAAPPAAPLPLRFSDGTDVTLQPAATARVVGIDAHGARLVLEAGRARVAVAHRPGARWHLKAGPFDVWVTGTRFDLQWTPAVGDLVLAMTDGAVTVSGGSLPGPRQVLAGETLTASVREPRWQISSGVTAPRDPAPAEPPAKVAPPSPPIAPAPAVSPSLSPSSAHAARAAGDWRALLAAGKYREALEGLDGRQFQRACLTDPPAELLALGDAARLVGQPARAREALLALRERFPGDARAAIAGFTLGRLAFDQRHAYQEAARWFARYLDEQPRGPLAREAAGRLIEARRQAGDAEGARLAARQYLRDYPSGPHAELARREIGDR